MPPGQPTSYNKKIAQEIAETVSVSSKGLKKLCAENPHWPCEDTIYTWRIAHPEFSELYTKAKKKQVEVFVEEIISIADDTSQDFCENSNGEEVANNELINRSRLRIDTRKWVAAKLAPRLYGDSVAIAELHARLDELEAKNAAKKIKG